MNHGQRTDCPTQKKNSFALGALMPPKGGMGRGAPNEGTGFCQAQERAGDKPTVGGNCDKPAAINAGHNARLPAAGWTWVDCFIIRWSGGGGKRKFSKSWLCLSAGSSRRRIPGQPMPPRQSQHFADVFQRAGVANDDVRAGALLFGRKLGRFAGGELLG